MLVHQGYAMHGPILLKSSSRCLCNDGYGTVVSNPYIAYYIDFFVTWYSNFSQNDELIGFPVISISVLLMYKKTVRRS